MKIDTKTYLVYKFIQFYTGGIHHMEMERYISDERTAAVFIAVAHWGDASDRDIVGRVRTTILHLPQLPEQEIENVTQKLLSFGILWQKGGRYRLTHRADKQFPDLMKHAIALTADRCQP